MPTVWAIIATTSWLATSGDLAASGRDWTGLNPFWQPVSTTDYYGSGDVDLDGNITAKDAEIIRLSSKNVSPASIRADVDGNGTVDENDVALLESALAGAILPGWWNQLSSATARKDWLERMLALDLTDGHPYSASWLQCVGFATQVFLNFASYNGDLFTSEFGAPQTKFNLPVYCVSILSAQSGHAVNAVLIGEDPRRYEHWFVFDPQNDREIVPGNDLFPIASTVTIYVPRDVQAAGHSRLERLVFTAGSSGTALKSSDSNLVVERGAPDVGAILNEAILWNPILLPTQLGAVVCERGSRDLLRVSALELIDDLLWAPASGVRLMTNDHFSRALDVSNGPRGSFRILWKGEPGYERSLFCGLLSEETGLTDITLVARGRSVFMGRVVQSANGTVHAFWLEMKLNTEHPYESGIYWSVLEGATWSDPKQVVPVGQDVDGWNFEEYADPRRCFFDVASTAQGELILVWARRQTLLGHVQLCESRYSGVWSEPRIIEELPQPTAGVDLLSDQAGRIHLAYWSGPSQQTRSEGRGQVRYRSANHLDWTEPELVNSEADAICPRLTELPDGTVAVVWDKLTDLGSRAAWSERRENSWTTAVVLPAKAGSRVRYPHAFALNSGLAVVAWSELSVNGSTVGFHYVRPVQGSSGQVVPVLAYNRESQPMLAWSTVPGQLYLLERSNNLLEDSWTPVGISELASGYVMQKADEGGTTADSTFYRVSTLPGKSSVP